MAASTFNLEGMDAALRRLQSVKVEVARKSVRSSAGKAMGVVRTAARNNAKRLDDPETGNSIAKNVALTTRYDRNRQQATARVGIRGGAKQTTKSNGRSVTRTTTGSGNSGGDTWYWRLLEFGTSRMRAQPFMRPALADNVSKVSETFVSDLNTSIDKAVAKAR